MSLPSLTTQAGLRSAFYAGLLLCLMTGTLVSCGKRPGAVDPPDSVVDDHFPRTYPDPATDPKP